MPSLDAAMLPRLGQRPQGTRHKASSGSGPKSTPKRHRAVGVFVRLILKLVSVSDVHASRGKGGHTAPTWSRGTGGRCTRTSQTQYVPALTTPSELARPSAGDTEAKTCRSSCNGGSSQVWVSWVRPLGLANSLTFRFPRSLLGSTLHTVRPNRRQRLGLPPRLVRLQVLGQSWNLRSCNLDDLRQHCISNRLCGSMGGARGHPLLRGTRLRGTYANGSAS